MRVLLVAPTDGTDVGEAAIGWQWASHLSRIHDVTLLTYRKRGRPSAVGQLPQVQVVEWTEPALIGRAERLNSLLKPAWLPFHAHARRWIVRALARGESYDVGHQPVPVAMRYPAPLAGLGIPYVLGPVGGSLESVPAFADGDTAPWYVRARELDGWRLRHDPWLRRTYQDAACVLGIAPYVRDILGDVELRRFEVMSDTGVDELPAPVDRSARPGPVRLLYVGRIIRTKGLRDAITALDRLRGRPVVLDVVGDGFDRRPCEMLVRELGLTDRVEFHGSLPHAEVARFYARADVFVFPSFREPGGIVVWEAMAHGLPLVVADRGGPGFSVDDTCGFRVPVRAPAQFAQALADVLTRLIDEPALRLALGSAARRRAADVAMWSSRVERATVLYRSIAR